MSPNDGSSVSDAVQRARRAYFEAAEPLLRELSGQGIQVETVGELRQRRRDLTAAAPVLVRWLPRVRYTGLKREIIAALGQLRGSPTAAAALIEEFERSDEAGQPSVKWEVGSALEALADDTLFTELVRLLRRTEYGKAREMLALALAKTNPARAVPVPLELLDDDVVDGHAVAALVKLRPPEAKTRLETMKNHPRPWVRREAVKALAAIERVESAQAEDG